VTEPQRAPTQAAGRDQPTTASGGWRMPVENVSPNDAERARRTYAQWRPVRAALRRGEISIAMVMRERPDALADRTLFEILLMAHQIGRARLRAINARAVGEHINLAVMLKDADERTRDWVIYNALPHGRKAPTSVWAQLLQD
jgi:hypothetical protein